MRKKKGSGAIEIIIFLLFLPIILLLNFFVEHVEVLIFLLISAAIIYILHKINDKRRSKYLNELERLSEIEVAMKREQNEINRCIEQEYVVLKNLISHIHYKIIYVGKLRSDSNLLDVCNGDISFFLTELLEKSKLYLYSRENTKVANYVIQEYDNLSKLEILDKSNNQRNEIEQLSKFENLLKIDEFKSRIFETSANEASIPYSPNPCVNWRNELAEIPEISDPDMRKLVTAIDSYVPSLDDFAEQLENSRLQIIDAIAVAFQEKYNDISDAKKMLSKDLALVEENWLKKENQLLEEGRRRKVRLESLILGFQQGDVSSVEESCKEVLKSIIYSDFFPVNINCQFKLETKTLIVDYQLPLVENFPNVKELKFIKTKNEYREIPISKTEKEKRYEDFIYSLVLNSVDQIYKFDMSNVIDTVAFNGWIETTDSSTGKDMNIYILSLRTHREDFIKVNLEKVLPKNCFNSFKGVSGQKLSFQMPITPVIAFDNNDRRFVEHRNINVQKGTNLAAMDWESFEHLIRQIFEKEFSSNGGEVKVTQASQDGGVDAVAFDPDPIRGGKIVIQAKRYTNTVGVASVRDLYGTVLNEGATKGILVTTATYGPDSYKFAQDKPLTLLNGQNLLALLQKHDYDAHIDIEAAKSLLK